MLFISVAALLTTALFMAINDIRAYRGEIVRDLTTLAKVIGENSKAAILFDDPESAHEVLTSLSSTEHVVCAGIFTDNNMLFTSYLRKNVDRENSTGSSRSDRSSVR